MKALMYGGGNIGRGFIGPLFSQGGYAVTFVDVAEPVVRQLNREGKYPLRFVSSEGNEDVIIQGVNAIHGNDIDAVAACIAETDIMATAVGVNVLKYIIPNLVAGLRARFAANTRPLNILICENLMNANEVLEGMIKAELTAAECELFDARVGLVEASIGRMVPVQTEDMKDGNPLRVCVERYGYLPIDKDAFKGEIPEIDAIVPAAPFDFYLKRKLYLHNMAHATCAYLGAYTGSTYIYEAIENPYILNFTKNAMLESVEAFCAEYGAELSPLLRHADDLLYRFTNKALGDTCARVGGDPKRKLSPADRLIGAASLCQKHGITPANIALGAAGAVHLYLQQEKLPQTREHAANVLRECSKLEERSELADAILHFYEMYAAGAEPAQMQAAVAAYKHAAMPNII